MCITAYFSTPAKLDSLCCELLPPVAHKHQVSILSITAYYTTFAKPDSTHLAFLGNFGNRYTIKELCTHGQLLEAARPVNREQ